MRPAVASAVSFPDFQFHSLGWKAFQDLCLTILSSQLGQAVKRFSPTRDGGRDGAFVGQWKPTDALTLTGETVVQCKFTSIKNTSLTPSGFAEELSKAAVLWKRRPRTNYVLLTNYRVSAEFEESAAAQFSKIGYAHFHVFGYEWLVGVIQASPRLRTLVPRLYGLGDLSQILDERWYAQTQKLLEAERDNLRKFVPTRSYRQAVEALNKYGFVLLLGEPAVGKTAIAATLTLASGDAWKCRPMKLERAPEIRERWNPDDPHQLFWIDDAFGAMQYDATRSHEWNSTLSWLNAVIRSGAKVILTSRDYIYAHARHDLKQSAFPLLRESQVVVNVADLSREEREQILYNHIRLGDQPAQWRRSFKGFFNVAAHHEEFRPEIARRLGTQAFTSNLVLTAAGVGMFVAQPEDFLLETIEGLSDVDRSALAAVFIRGGQLPLPVDLTAPEHTIIARLGGTSHSISAGLSALRGTFVRVAVIGGECWTFKHPTIGDAFASYLADNPDYVDLYISGASMAKVLAEVTCGHVNLEGVKVIVPPSRFALMTRRLHEYHAIRSGTSVERWRRHHQYYNFLANRCSTEFLRSYIDATPEFWKQALGFGSYLSAMPQFSLLATLRQLQMLPPEHLTTIMQRVKYLAVETPDAEFLRIETLQCFFTTAEVTEVMQHVRSLLIPALDETVNAWQANYSTSDDASEYFESLVDALDAYRSYFSEDETARRALTETIDRVKELVSMYQEPEEDDEHEEYYEFDEPTPSGQRQTAELMTRPIYDDLDE